MRLTLGKIAELFHSPIPPGIMSIIATGASIDSRNIKPGDVFFCLRGERTDGHDFAGQAIENGASAIVASRPLPQIDAPVICVSDCERALGNLAAYWRSKTRARVICLTGTAGKTSLKEALKGIFATAGTVNATQGNHNNQIGLPLTILRGEANDDFWILETGISHSGDMDYLGNIARPDLAILLNAGAGHTEGLGDRGVAWHKARLVKYLAPGGKVLVNAEYPELLRECHAYCAQPILFGKNQEFSLMERKPDGASIFSLAGKKIEFQTPFLSSFEGENALAAVVAASISGLKASQIQAGFKNCSLPEHRNSLIQNGPYIIIDASYNANPLSMRCSLLDAAAKAKAASKPLILVLGAMGELGREAPAAHRELGVLIGDLEPGIIFWIGDHLEDIKTGLSSSSENKKKLPVVFRAANADAFLCQWLRLQKYFPDGALFLFKGSRVNQLEKYATALLNKIAGDNGASCDVL